jgi:hypothetical protein|tara:strand:- start:2937 stop:3833 length:897 start_codon:yes stop_codon:yes gene_type:complete
MSDEWVFTSRVAKLAKARAAVSEVWGAVPKYYSHAVLVQVGMPYRDPGEGTRSFTRSSGPYSLRMEAGALPRSSGGFVEVGLPFGPRARLLLLHLSAVAVKHQSPVVEISDSFTAFARDLGLSTGGRNLASLRAQLNRMSVVSMRLAKHADGFSEVFQGSVFRRLVAETPNDPRQIPLWASEVEFSAEYFESLCRNAVPLRREAIQALKHSSRAMDIYAYLAHRLYRVEKPLTLSWSSLSYQFGDPGKPNRMWKSAFKAALKQVLVVYPEAKVEPVYGGIVLKQSPPPVRRKARALIV